MTKQCCICGCEFHPYHKRQVTCGSAECKRLQHLAYLKHYNKVNAIKHREYNRAWMKKKREEQKAYGEARANRERADNYAERQMQKTLSLAGRIEL